MFVSLTNIINAGLGIEAGGNVSGQFIDKERNRKNSGGNE